MNTRTQPQSTLLDSTALGSNTALDSAALDRLPVTPDETPTTGSARTLPLTGLQRGLWFLDRWDPGSATYNIAWVFEFDGPVDLDLLERAVDQVVRRHDALRTTFGFDGTGPVQILRDQCEVPFARTDLDGTTSTDEIVDAEARTGFDLESGPLIRARAVCGPGEPTRLVLVVHHIVWDGWSADVVERELAEVYSALSAGREPVLPDLTGRYEEYVRDHAAQPWTEQLEYWQEQLRDAPTVLELPTDRPRPATQTFHGATAHFGLPPGTAGRVRELAADTGATPFMVLLSAFAVLLNRHTGAADLVVGTPVTTRNRPELEDLVGYLVNVVPLRVAVRQEATFRELLEQVSDTAFDAYANLDVPLDSIVDMLALDRSAQHAPLVQVLFGSHAEDAAPVDFGPVRATRRVWANGTSKFDLTWSTYDSGELRGEVEFNTDLFDAATIHAMTDHWRTLLAVVLADCDRPLWQVDLLDDAERAAQVVTPVDTDWSPRCLHQAFEATVDRYPDRPALTHDGYTRSYAELDARANRLAHVLMAAGVGRGDRVGLLLDRTGEIVVSVLAVLKAGAAYVPVDPAAPADRAAFVFGDTDVSVVVTDRPETVPSGRWEVLDLGGRAGAIAAAPATRPSVTTDPDDLAYVIFTSGSTGRPKGVAVAHAHVTALMGSAQTHFGYTEHDVWTLFHSHAFDVSVYELWGALLHGGRLAVVPYLTSRNPDAFAALLADERVSALSLTPSALRQLELALRQTPRELPALRWIMLAGEALEPDLVQRWFALDPTPPAVLCNLYGTTETTVHVTMLDVAEPTQFPRSVVGGPMPHLGLAVLDEWMRPCPVGVPGELHVSGSALAHGYWGRAGLTAERFVPDPFSGIPGARMYRTGDLARRLPDGGLEYLGRRDHQVKIRGFRMELGEIEATVRDHPAVEQCVVTVRESVAGERTLAAYITGAVTDAGTGPGELPDQPALREFLARSLPDYMIPATVTVLQSLPTTVNGKVDRRALPAPVSRPDRPRDGRVAPSTPQERALCAVWEQVLEVTDVDRRDHFFHLGGDSIRAVRMAGQVREHGWTVSLQDVFQSPRLADLAALLQPVDPADEQPVSEPFDLVSAADRAALPPDVVDAYPMVDMQLAMVYHMELSGAASNYHNVNSYRLSARLDERLLRQALADVTARHPVLRTSLDMSAYSQPLQLVHANAPVLLDYADLRGHSPSEQDAAVQAVFQEHCETGFDLRVPPLLRCALQRLSDEVFQFTVTEHHAIVDGWSFTSLFTEILERHAELLADPTAAPVAPPASTFRDFIAVERAAATAPASVRFWQDRLDGVSGELWPTDPGAQDLLTDRPRTLERVLPEAADWLRTAARTANVPVKAVALGAHLVALRAVTGRDRLTTGISMNGRLERAGGAEAYGLFLNTIPLAVDLDHACVRDLLRDLHAEELAMMPHRRMPFARLARLMTSTRLDTNFVYLRFHSLGRLGAAATNIVDTGIGCEPTMRYERTSFALGVALVQDPVSERVMLAAEHNRSVVPDDVADRYVDAYARALRLLAECPDGSPYLTHPQRETAPWTPSLASQSS